MSCLYNQYKPHYFAGRGLYEGSHAVGHTGISPGIPRRSFDGDLDGWMVQGSEQARQGLPHRTGKTIYGVNQQ